MADCKKCYWYKHGTCENKYASKDFDYYYRHPEKDCREYE